jgi:hypothetical protein
VQLGERMILRRLRSISFRERIPTFMCVVQAHILDDAHGAEDGLRIPRHCRDGCRRIAPRSYWRPQSLIEIGEQHSLCRFRKGEFHVAR